MTITFDIPTFLLVIVFILWALGYFDPDDDDGDVEDEDRPEPIRPNPTDSGHRFATWLRAQYPRQTALVEATLRVLGYP